MLIAAVIFLGNRWWWTSALGALISLFSTAGWFAFLPDELRRIADPTSIVGFSIGIFFGAGFWLGFESHLIGSEIWINWTRPMRILLSSARSR